MSTPTYRLHQVKKAYEDRLVLDVDSLEINQGEIFALVGPSGAGKSSLLRLLNFLEPPTSGSIYFSNIQASTSQKMPLEYRRRITTVFQRPVLLNRNVWANVQVGLRFRGQKNAHKRIERALQMVGMLDLAQQSARSLSGGEAQRVALARAMVLQPEVLLLDEPTANLDPYNIGLIEDTVRSINQRDGTTIVLVTHNIFQARRLADRVALLLDGHIVEVNEVEAFFKSPTDPRTLKFVIGEMVY
jgi:tungstate transport system ATP-binding protein